MFQHQMKSKRGSMVKIRLKTRSFNHYSRKQRFRKQKDLGNGFSTLWTTILQLQLVILDRLLRIKTLPATNFAAIPQVLRLFEVTGLCGKRLHLQSTHSYATFVRT